MRRHRNKRKTCVFLDNLSFHHSRVVLEQERKNKQQDFISSMLRIQVSTIRLKGWGAIAKRQFTRNLITEANYKDKK